MEYNLGLAFALQKKYPESFTHFEAALHGAPDNPETHLSYSSALSNYGVMLSESGRHEEAMATYDKALQLNPNNDATKKNRDLDRGLVPGVVGGR